MLKKEIAKLLEALNDDDNVDDVISKSDLGKVLAASGLTLDAFKSKLESDPNFKSFMDSEKDKHSTKALETWKTNNLQKEIDTEIKKRYPEQDPKDKANADLKAEIEKIKADNLRKDLVNSALKTMTEKKLPTDLVNFIVGNDEDTTNKNLETLSKAMGEHDNFVKTELLKSSSYVPPVGGSDEKPGSIARKLIDQNKNLDTNMQQARDSYFK